MSKALMPHESTCREKSNRISCRLGNWIEIVRTVTSKKDMTSQVILHRKTKGVKFNSTIIVSSELTKRNEIFNNIGGYKNIMNMKRAMMERNNDMASVGDGNRLAITNHAADQRIQLDLREKVKRETKTITYLDVEQELILLLLILDLSKLLDTHEHGHKCGRGRTKFACLILIFCVTFEIHPMQIIGDNARYEDGSVIKKCCKGSAEKSNDEADHFAFLDVNERCKRICTEAVNLQFAIKAKTITSGLKYSLATGNWGQANAAGTRAVLVRLIPVVEDGNVPSDVVQRVGAELAMHVVAAKPLVLTKELVSSDAVQNEREILKLQAKSSGRPQAAIEKMVEGRLWKYFGEVVLVEQNIIVNDTINVKTLLSELSNEVGSPVTIFKNASFVG
nr:elongation factor Ts, mitochondrial [Tanacetum cinerariifolium]